MTTYNIITIGQDYTNDDEMTYRKISSKYNISLKKIHDDFHNKLRFENPFLYEKVCYKIFINKHPSIKVK